MDTSTKRELESIKRELQSIINELNSIAANVGTDFNNIGNERCAKGITRVSEQYQWVKRQLNNIN